MPSYSFQMVGYEIRKNKSGNHKIKYTSLHDNVDITNRWKVVQPFELEKS